MSQTMEEVLKQREDQEDVNTNSPSAMVKGQLCESYWKSILPLKTSAFSCLLMMERLFLRRSRAKQQS